MQNNTFIRLILILFLLINIFFFSRAYSTGGITTDGTLGLPVKVIGAPNSKTDVVIKQSDGLTKGGNLFHSFAKFNIASGQTVTFAENDNAIKSVDNVISRVTGGTTSDINGLLQVTPGGKANFYLINPSGITFGPDAQVDVPGSIHVSTADQLKLTDGKVFSAVHPTGNSLSSAAPSAFGFLGTSAINNGLLKIDSSLLEIKQGKSFDVVSGQIYIEDKHDVIAYNIHTTEGEVRLVAIHGPTEISVIQKNNGNLTLPSATPSHSNSGDIIIKKALIKIDGKNAGKVGIWGRDLIISKSGGINIENIDSTKNNKESGVSINSNSLFLQSDGTIQTFNEFNSLGKSSDINLKIKHNLVIDNGLILTTSSGINNSGNITITIGNDLIIKNNGEISTAISGNVKGNNINIKTGRDIILATGGIIKTAHDSSVGGIGEVGNINLKSGRNILILGSTDSSFKTSILATTKNESQAGDIILIAKGNINLLSGGHIDNSTTGKGTAGNIIISAGKNISVDQQNNTNVETLISSRSENIGNAGTINLKAVGNITLNGSSISSNTFGKGLGGSIQLNGLNILVNNSEIGAASINKSSGKPGNIDIFAQNNLNLDRSSLSIENNSGNFSFINTSSESRLSVSAININLKNSQISTRSSGNQPAGSITINFSDIAFLDPSIITTESEDGNGGNINIQGGNVIIFKNSGLITSVRGSMGNGGNINVNTDNLVMETGLVQANTNATGGSGGNINLNLKGLITSGNMLRIGDLQTIAWSPFEFGLNIIQAAAPSGLNGQIHSNAPQLNLSGELSNLGIPQFDSDFLSQEYCPLRSDSSLRQLGKGGFPLKAREAWVY